MNIIDKNFLDQKVLELHQKGKTAAQIGLELRDQYLVVPAIRLSKLYPFLKSTHCELENEVLKLEALKEHYRKHHHDFKAQRAIQKVKPKINKLSVLLARKNKKNES